ncbi:hypothetical protein DITRI_Ditri16bG0016500 [Diplodiscus trichospermus]
MTFKLDKGRRITDFFQGIELTWRYVCYEMEKKGNRNDPQVVEKRYFELRFKKKYRDIVLNSYLPFVSKSAEMIESETRVLKIHTLANSHYSCKFKWESIKLEHPSTFETLALDTELKNMIMEDLNRFLRRKEFYKRVGRPWKRGYLLYGPPGTGKSSLDAAMANYLKFDIYDLQLENIKTDSELRKLLLDIENKSILVIEDIDCTVNLPDRPRVSASGHKRSGKERQAFRVLASNYLGIEGEHWLFGDIKELLETTKVTPAQVAEELMKNEDSDIALEGFFSFLKHRKTEESELENEASKKIENKEHKEPNIEHKCLKEESIPCKSNI